MRGKFLQNPQFLGVLGATGATILGVLVMAAAGAPKAYLIINIAALGIGISLLSLMLRSRPNTAYAGWLILAAAAGLLAAALLGTTIDGVTRWVRIGVVSLQPSLLLLPLMAITFARVRDAKMTMAMLIAAVALAIQPDRAMAGALVAGLAALAVTVRDRQVLFALVAALCSFAVTLVRPDPLPPTPFVEQVFAGAFGFSTVAGLALLAGSALLLLPMLALHRTDATVFAAVWLAILAAAVIGNYPTPLLGYGGSGILGYLLCLAGLPRHARQQAGWSALATPDEDRSEDGSASARLAW
jgi:cell division protein FtsW (lipid II flippase)